MLPIYLWTSGDIITPLANCCLEVKGYGCSLVELYGHVSDPNKYEKMYYLCCDIVDECHVQHTLLPALRQFRVDNSGMIRSTLTNLIWRPVRRRGIDSIRLYICDMNGKIISFDGTGLYCTLVIDQHCHS